MAMNDRTPAGANGEGSGNVFVDTGDTFQIAPHRSEIQSFRLRRRFGMSEAAARAVADLAWPTSDHWRARA